MSRDKNVKVSKWGDRPRRGEAGRKVQRCGMEAANKKCTRDKDHQGMHYDLEKKVAFK